MTHKIKLIKLIEPDAAQLVFEQYYEEEADIQSAKQELNKVVANISMSLGKYIKVETVVASDYPEF